MRSAGALDCLNSAISGITAPGWAQRRWRSCARSSELACAFPSRDGTAPSVNIVKLNQRLLLSQSRLIHMPRSRPPQNRWEPAHVLCAEQVARKGMAQQVLNWWSKPTKRIAESSCAEQVARTGMAQQVVKAHEEDCGVVTRRVWSKSLHSRGERFVRIVSVTAILAQVTALETKTLCLHRVRLRASSTLMLPIALKRSNVTSHRISPSSPLAR